MSAHDDHVMDGNFCRDTSAGRMLKQDAEPIKRTEEEEETVVEVQVKSSRKRTRDEAFYEGERKVAEGVELFIFDDLSLFATMVVSSESTSDPSLNLDVSFNIPCSSDDGSLTPQTESSNCAPVVLPQSSAPVSSQGNVLYDDDNNVLEDDVEPAPSRDKHKTFPPGTDPTQIPLITADSESGDINKDLAINPYISVDRLKNSDALVHYYTGFDSFDLLETVFWTLGDNVDCLTYLSKKRPLTCFLMMLVYLRCRYDVEELARMFSVPASIFRDVCLTWIKFCAYQWKELDIWPEARLVRYCCPQDFKEKYANTRVILDTIEIPIKKPKDQTSLDAAYSTSKFRSTVKAVVGFAPSGLISFVSPAYGGSATERQIVERSDLVNLVEEGDVVMAGSGFDVHDIFAAKGVKVVMPPVKRKMIRSSRTDIRTVSSKGVHFKRTVRDVEMYNILTSKLNAAETVLASEIIYVCCMLTNFRAM